MQAYLEDINTMGLVSDHQDVTGGMKFLVQKLFGFSVYIKVIFILHCSLLSMQEHYVYKNNIYTLI